MGFRSTFTTEDYNIQMIYTWKGKPIAALSREELIEVVNWLSRELETLREERNAWMKSGSAVQYMLQKDKREIK